MADTKFVFTADDSQVVEAVKRVEAGLEAAGDAGSKAGNAIGKGLERVEEAAKQADKTTSKAASSIDRMGNAAGKAGQWTQKLAGALGIMSPEAAGAARDLADLADVGEVAAEAGKGLGASLAAVGAATAVVSAAAIIGYGVWNSYATAERVAAREAENLRSTLAAVAPASDRVAEARLEADRATGLLTDAEYAYQKALKTAAAARDADIAAALKAKGVTEDQAEKVRLLMGGTGQYAQALAQADQTVVQAVVAANAISTGYDEQAKQLLRVRDGTLAKEEADKRAAASSKRAADAERDRNEHLRVQADALREADAAERDARKGASDTVAKLAAMESEAVESRVSLTETASARVVRIKQEELAQIEALERAGLDAKGVTADEQVAVQERAATARVAVEADAAAQIADIRKQEAERERDMQDARVGYSADIAGALASIASTASESMTDEQKGAAKALYAISKAAALAEAALNAALAVSEASTVAPPLNIPAMAAAGIIGAANVAAVAAVPAPKFHIGRAEVQALGIRRVDEINATLKAKEAVVSEQGVDQLGGRRVIEAANSGRLRGGEGGGTAVMFGHRAIHATMREAVRTPGPLSRAMNKGKIVGHRGRS